MGGAPRRGSRPVCDAGYTYPLVVRTVTRNACWISYGGLVRLVVAHEARQDRQPGRIRRCPSVSGRRLFVFMSKNAPEPASHRPVVVL